MNYADFREHILMLLNQFTSNGVILDNLYNDQSDYVLRIPQLYNSAMIDIMSYGKPFVSILDKEECEAYDDGKHGWLHVDLPKDFSKIHSIWMSNDDGRPYRSTAYYTIGDEILMIDPFVWKESWIEYERYPKKLDTTIGADIDNVKLDGDIQQQTAAALYVAARLVMQDDAFAYSSFMNEYDDRVGKMRSRMTAEITFNPDSYDTASMYAGF